MPCGASFIAVQRHARVLQAARRGAESAAERDHHGGDGTTQVTERAAESVRPAEHEGPLPSIVAPPGPPGTGQRAGPAEQSPGVATAVDSGDILCSPGSRHRGGTHRVGQLEKVANLPLCCRSAPDAQ